MFEINEVSRSAHTAVFMCFVWISEQTAIISLYSINWLYVEIKCQLDATEVFYCRSYCLLNMFRASLCPSSGAQKYYTVVAACGILCCGFSSSWSGAELRVMCPVCRMLQHPANRTHNPQLMGIVMPETCWASNKICNKNLCCIYLAFHFHILTTMHGQNHIKFIFIFFIRSNLQQGAQLTLKI